MGKKAKAKLLHFWAQRQQNTKIRTTFKWKGYQKHSGDIAPAIYNKQGITRVKKTSNKERSKRMRRGKQATTTKSKRSRSVIDTDIDDDLVEDDQDDLTQQESPVSGKILARRLTQAAARRREESDNAEDNLVGGECERKPGQPVDGAPGKVRAAPKVTRNMKSQPDTSYTGTDNELSTHSGSEDEAQLSMARARKRPNSVFTDTDDQERSKNAGRRFKRQNTGKQAISRHGNTTEILASDTSRAGR